jgi:hypothetical protein
MQQTTPVFRLKMKARLFEVFVEMIGSLPVNGVLLAAKLERRIIEDDLSKKRDLPMKEAVSVLNFCRFLQAVALGNGIFPTALPGEHIASYRRIVNRLVEAGELPLNANEQFDMTFLSGFLKNQWLIKLGNERVEYAPLNNA